MIRASVPWMGVAVPVLPAPLRGSQVTISVDFRQIAASLIGRRYAAEHSMTRRPDAETQAAARAGAACDERSPRGTRRRRHRRRARHGTRGCAGRGRRGRDRLGHRRARRRARAPSLRTASGRSPSTSPTRTAWSSLAAAIRERDGHLDGLVNNAGIASRQRLPRRRARRLEPRARRQRDRPDARDADAPPADGRRAPRS